MLGVAGGPHHVLLLLLVVPSLEPAPRTLPICHLANLPFVVCLAFNKYSRAAHSSDDPLILQILHNRPGTWPLPQGLCPLTVAPTVHEVVRPTWPRICR